MPYRILCNDVQREGVKASPDLASRLFQNVPLHNIRYGIASKARWLFIREQTSHTTKEQYVAVIALSVHHRGPAPRLS